MALRHWCAIEKTPMARALRHWFYVRAPSSMAHKSLRLWCAIEKIHWRKPQGRLASFTLSPLRGLRSTGSS